MAGEKMSAKTTTKSNNDDGLFGALCYIIAVLVPLFVIFTDKKNNKFLLFHAWQSLIFSAVLILGFVLFTILTTVITIITAGLGSVLSCLMLPVSLAALAYELYLAYKAYQGEKYMIPHIGEYAEKQVAK